MPRLKSKTPPQALTANQRRLIRRYLVWCYKTTKENLDRIDRKFTQLIVDDFMFEELKKAGLDQSCPQPFKEFNAYIEAKRASAFQEKFSDTSAKTVSDQYEYLIQRLAAVEKSIVRFLGRSALIEIVELYEAEMTRRILASSSNT